MATQLETTVEQLLERALQLPIQKRIELAEALSDSVDEEDPSVHDAAWGKEIERRVGEIDLGEAELIPADVVFARVRERLKQISDAPRRPQLEMTFEQLLERTLQLPIQRRTEFAETVFDSAHEEDPAALEAAWGEEIKRRVDEIRNGTVETYSAEEVFAEMRARFG